MLLAWQPLYPNRSTVISPDALLRASHKRYRVLRKSCGALGKVVSRRTQIPLERGSPARLLILPGGRRSAACSRSGAQRQQTGGRSPSVKTEIVWFGAALQPIAALVTSKSSYALRAEAESWCAYALRAEAELRRIHVPRRSGSQGTQKSRWSEARPRGF
jgi:hypothetical protein